MKERLINGYLLSKQGDITSLDKVSFIDTLENIKEMINCDYIEMPIRYINGNPYIIVIDEEGRLKDNQFITAISNDEREFLVGNILIVGLADNDGNITSLNESDYATIKGAYSKALHLIKYSFKRG